MKAATAARESVPGAVVRGGEGHPPRTRVAPGVAALTARHPVHPQRVDRTLTGTLNPAPAAAKLGDVNRTLRPYAAPAPVCPPQGNPHAPAHHRRPALHLGRQEVHPSGRPRQPGAHPPLLLPPRHVRGRVLPHLPRRGRRPQPAQRGPGRAHPQARPHLPDPRRRRHGGPPLQQPQDRAEPESGHGDAPDQPPARLPRVRPGRRVQPAGLQLRLRPQQQPVRRNQDQAAQEGPGPQRPALQRPLHHVQPLRPLHPRSHRHERDRHLRPRQQRTDRRLPRQAPRQRALGQRHRHLPRRRPAGQRLPDVHARLEPHQDRQHRRHHRQRRQPQRRAQRRQGLPPQAPHQRRRQPVVDQRRDPLRLEARPPRRPPALPPAEGPGRSRRARLEPGLRRRRQGIQKAIENKI